MNGGQKGRGERDGLSLWGHSENSLERTVVSFSFFLFLSLSLSLSLSCSVSVVLLPSFCQYFILLSISTRACSFRRGLHRGVP